MKNALEACKIRLQWHLRRFKKIIGIYDKILYKIAYSSIVMLIASLAKESGKTIIITVMGTIILYIIEMGFVHKYEIVRIIYQNSIFYQIYEAFRPVITFNEIGKNLLISVSTFIIMAYCGTMIFRRLEIK